MLSSWWRCSQYHQHKLLHSLSFHEPTTAKHRPKTTQQVTGLSHGPYLFMSWIDVYFNVIYWSNLFLTITSDYYDDASNLTLYGSSDDGVVAALEGLLMVGKYSSCLRLRFCHVVLILGLYCECREFYLKLLFEIQNTIEANVRQWRKP